MGASSPSLGLQRVVWGALAAVILAITALFFREEMNRTGDRSPLPVFGELPSFTLTNQIGRKIVLQDLLGQPWIGDIIFTRCAGPCPRMTRTMSALQTNLPVNVRFVTLTTDPENDTPPVLKKYSEKFQADPSRWTFLTGAKPEIKRLATEGLKLAAVEKGAAQQENENDLFIHSTTFVLIDKRGRLRSSFESDDPELRSKIATAVARLERDR